MSWWKKKGAVDVGSRTETTSFTIDGQPRTVRDDVVSTIDAALGALGGEVLHAIDPKRILRLAAGGPPVWSVGLVEIGGARPYTLAVTYGFSHVLSPDDERLGQTHEFSIAVPDGCAVHPWAVALLRHLSRYVLSSGNDLLVGDVMPCHAPITRVPFPPANHAAIPPTSLDSVVIVPDPVLPRIATRHGDIEVRRIVGIDNGELHRLGPMAPASRVAARAQVDALALSDTSQ